MTKAYAPQQAGDIATVGYINSLAADLGASLTPDGHLDATRLVGALPAAAGLPPFAHTAAEHGYLVWSGDPLDYKDSLALFAGRIHLSRVMAPYSLTCATLTYTVLTAGAGLSNCFVGLYSSAGSRLWVSADQSTNMQSAAVRTVTTGGIALSGGQSAFIWVAILAGAGSPLPTLANKGGNGSVYSNVGLTAATCRAGYITTGGQTTLPASFTPSTALSLDATHWWAALS